ncbi:hypothetical protein N7501_011113 [Penicillium viridicatum]|nr:hypothetical protein N7501_011113 [Penicillium viridicatum]
MAIIVYFIDKDWNYREILLGFEPLHGPYIGNNLSDVLYRLLEERKLLDQRLLSIRAISSRELIVRVPCIAYIIQLCLKQLLGYIRAAPKNKESDTQAYRLKDSINYRDVAYILTKIRSFTIFVNNSTFLMLRRARRLRNIIDKYCYDHKYSQLKVTDVE